MPHILKNDILELAIDLPTEGYYFSRFDWTGKIIKVRFKGIDISTTERTDNVDEHLFGKGLYNEFGIDSALGYDEAHVGDWFHKIGIGLLKKDDDTYVFHKPYDIDPLEFKVTADSNQITSECESKQVNEYSYHLKKKIELFYDHFKISYELRNTGKKPIVTEEYNHNFVAIDHDVMGPNYKLRFPFILNPELFDDCVNPDLKIDIGNNEFSFNGGLEDQFFFSNLTGNKEVDASWELSNLKSKIKISETGSFKTNKINLWGWKHVISPELFHRISIAPGESTEWTRTYNFYDI